MMRHPGQAQDLAQHEQHEELRLGVVAPIAISPRLAMEWASLVARSNIGVHGDGGAGTQVDQVCRKSPRPEQETSNGVGHRYQ